MKILEPGDRMARDTVKWTVFLRVGCADIVKHLSDEAIEIPVCRIGASLSTALGTVTYDFR